MPRSKSLTILFDLTHNNLLSPQDPDFSQLIDFLQSKEYTLLYTHSHKLTAEELADPHVLIIGVPQNSYFLQDEIHLILDYVRSGGALILFQRYGGDAIQKTDLNELASLFGIYFDNSIVKDSNNVGVELLPLVSVNGTHPITKNVHKLVMPGACTLRLARDAKPLFFSPTETGWIELYNPTAISWLKDDSHESFPFGAYATYGQGRIVAFCSPDFLHNNPVFGIGSLDNRRLFQNVLSWLIQPVSDAEVRVWILTQLGTFSEDLSILKNSVSKTQSTLQTLEHRISDLEHKYWAGKGIHLPDEDEK
jgi:hypothetical protein